MTTTLWDTTGSEVISALHAERRVAGAVTSGLALSLVVVVDEKRVREAEEAAMTAAAAHPFRLLIVVRRSLQADSRLDAEVSVGGRLGPTEAVIMRMYGRLTLHAESVVLPLLAPDAPVVTWWHGPPPDEIATDPLGVIAGRRLTDCAQAPDPIAALRQRAQDYAPGDTDLGWTRTTPWRALLASACDATTATPKAARVEGEPDAPSAELLAGWLRSRLGVDVARDSSDVPGGINAASIHLGREDGSDLHFEISRPDGRMARLTRSGEPDRNLPLPRRALGDLLAEELRRMDADEIYADALQAATGTSGLSDRSPRRTHVWRDPEQEKSA
jgi:glucose-6-phosphate dehydrogenase assembly protein OpcA